MKIRCALPDCQEVIVFGPGIRRTKIDDKHFCNGKCAEAWVAINRRLQEVARPFHVPASDTRKERERLHGLAGFAGGRDPGDETDQPELPLRPPEGNVH